MTSEQEAELPAWREEMSGLCPAQWKGLGCLPDWQGECANCGHIRTKPREHTDD